MSKVDIEIYVSNMVKFFEQNPDELSKLIPLDKKFAFFDKIKKTSFFNKETGVDFVLTRQQLVDISVLLNGVRPENNIKYFITPIGLINLN
jgi:hypothetical protein